MAHKKVRVVNGRDSNSQRLGVKRFGGEEVSWKYFTSSKRYEICQAQMLGAVKILPYSR
jgi:hypothetical protein